MNERLLQYIWQFQHFNNVEMETTIGEKLVIIKPGNFNSNQGPDFLDARIKIDNNTWAGNIEIHVNASDWNRHRHSTDPNYKNVILHVVWSDDDAFPLHEIPTLILADRVPKILLQQYQQWMSNKSHIPCESLMPGAGEIIWLKWNERLLIERLNERYARIALMLKQNKYNWEETTWWLVARNFGLPINTDAFESAARAIPFSELLQHRSDPVALQNSILKKLREGNIPLHYLRMRPAAFPDVRVRALAELFCNRQELFGIITESETTRQLRAIFPNAILINAVAPLLYAFGQINNNEQFINKALQLLSTLPPEKNSIVDSFTKMGISSACAADSQSLIELKTRYCDHRRCLECAIGNTILNRKLNMRTAISVS